MCYSNEVRTILIAIYTKYTSYKSYDTDIMMYNSE